MILRAVHEAHGTRPANALVSGSGPRVLWTLGGGSETFLRRVIPPQTPSAAYGAPSLRSLRNWKARETGKEGDLLKEKGVGGVRRCFHLGNTAEKWGYFLHFC